MERNRAVLIVAVVVLRAIVLVHTVVALDMGAVPTTVHTTVMQVFTFVVVLK